MRFWNVFLLTFFSHPRRYFEKSGRWFVTLGEPSPSKKSEAEANSLTFGSRATPRDGEQQASQTDEVSL